MLELHENTLNALMKLLPLSVIVQLTFEAIPNSLCTLSIAAAITSWAWDPITRLTAKQALRLCQSLSIQWTVIPRKLLLQAVHMSAVVETCLKLAFSSAIIKLVFEFEYSLWSLPVKKYLFFPTNFPMRPPIKSTNPSLSTSFRERVSFVIKF